MPSELNWKCEPENLYSLFRPTATSDNPIGGGMSRSSGSAHGATSVSNSFTCPTLCFVDLLMCALYIQPARPIGIGVAKSNEVETRALSKAARSVRFE